VDSYQITIDLKSDVLIGIGEGYGAIVDCDVVLDDVGLPYIPSKRIKGIMRESAEELNEMLKVYKKRIDIDEIFGAKGAKEGMLHLANFYMKEYENSRLWLKYLINNEQYIVNKQNITEQLTALRYSTAIDGEKGFAKKHSLRTERVIAKSNNGDVFIAEVECPEAYEIELALICQNIRRIGTKRTRGLGKVDVLLIKNKQNFNGRAIKKLEDGGDL